MTHLDELIEELEQMENKIAATVDKLGEDQRNRWMEFSGSVDTFMNSIREVEASKRALDLICAKDAVRDARIQMIKLRDL